MRQRSGADSKTGRTVYLPTWSWLQFGCAFALVFGLAFWHVQLPFHGLGVHLVITIAIAGACGWLAGRFGDVAWQAIVRILRWL